ncbi:MAG: glycosyltransferase [Prevotellaceae bacterium]|jgi:glycosyltransferase involved in cell wall biosynthesis|nr:glycosyltransferase [Prevotellaceae bacterium]
MKVSIIIPVYNVSAYIERCLLSVLNQTWQELEVVVVDDCTPDNSMEIVNAVVASHPRGEIVKIMHHNVNRGLSAARNTGTCAATGEYVYYLDSDDYVSEDCITSLAEMATAHKPDFVIGNYQPVGGKCWALPLRLPTGILYGNWRIMSAFVRDEWYVMAWNKLIRLSFIFENEIFFQFGITAEDEYWSFKVACAVRKMCVVDKVTYFYVMQPDSIVHTPSRNNLDSRVAVVARTYDYIISMYLSDNPLVNRYFEQLKERSFETIVRDEDTSYHRQSYRIFREIKLLSPTKLLFGMGVGLKQRVLNVHYMLPKPMGYHYYKALVRGKMLLIWLKWRLNAGKL